MLVSGILWVRSAKYIPSSRDTYSVLGILICRGDATGIGKGNTLCGRYCCYLAVSWRGDYGTIKRQQVCVHLSGLLSEKVKDKNGMHP